MRAIAIGAALGIACSSTWAETISYEAFVVHSDGSRTLLAKGARKYSPSRDIEVIPPGPYQPVGMLCQKRLLLFGEFEIEAAVVRRATLDGFGLAVNERTNSDGFSWNWFGRQEGDVFGKLRGGGRVKATIASGVGYVELASVEVLDDIALGYTDHLDRHALGAYSHELVIRKGSVFRVAP